MEAIERLKRAVLCEWVNLHVGYPEMVGDTMTFYCTRCESHRHPIDPATTERITRQLYAEEGYDYDEMHSGLGDDR